MNIFSVLVIIEAIILHLEVRLCCCLIQLFSSVIEFLLMKVSPNLFVLVSSWKTFNL